MSICVAVGNKVMDTRLPQPAGCGDKYDVSGWYLRRLLSAFCMFFNKYPSPDAKASPSPARSEGSRLLRRYTPRNDAVTNGEGLHRPWCDKILGTRPRMTGGRGANSFGRSMIEMLGVLAIIGVLSVGGIAGYNKAMSMWRINKSISEYSYFIAGMLEYKDNLAKNTDTSNEEFSIIEFAEAANLIPATWKPESGKFITDTFGNMIKPYIHTPTKQFVIDVYIPTAGVSSSAAETMQFCTTLFTNAAKPLSDYIYESHTYSMKGSYRSSLLYGSKFCSSDANCLLDANLSQIQTACRKCIQTADGRCGIIMVFD